MFRLLLSVCLLCFFVGLDQVKAQGSSTNHQHPQTIVIDGAVHPELIPAATAYRIYLYAISTSQSPTDEDRKRQHAHLMKTGLDETDHQILVGILSDFRSRYDALITEYNATATTALARNQSTDVRTLLKGFDDLVQSTRDTISARLSPQGAAKLHAFVMSEKKNMKVQGED